MKKFLLFLGICTFMCSLFCAKADSSNKGTPIYRESDLPVKFYLESYEECSSRSSLFGKMEVAYEEWCTIPSDIRKKKYLEKGIGSDSQCGLGSWYYLEIKRFCFRSNKETLDWLKNGVVYGNTDVLGTASTFEDWEKGPFSKELTQELGCLCGGDKLPLERRAIIVKDNVVMRVDLRKSFSDAEEKKFVRKGPIGEPIGDYIDVDFIGLLKKFLSRL